MGVSTPREQTTLLAALAETRSSHLISALTSAASSSDSTSRTSCRAGSAGTLRPVPRPRAGRSSRLKNGELDGIRADVAIVRHAEQGTLVLAVFTDGRDLRETVDVEGALAVAECSAAICARLLGLDV